MRSKIKSKRLATLIIILVFAFTSLLSLISFAPATKASGESENYNSSLRFRQVEVGEDFAIALTYGGDLYGWSLIKDAAQTSFGAAGGTLGTYYPGVPTKIPVTFYKDNGSKAGMPLTGADTASIKKIAVTRTTAAFITQDADGGITGGGGYVYTWGYDEANEFKHGVTGNQGDKSSGILVKNQLLFRNEIEESSVYNGYYGIDTGDRNLYIPQPIMHRGFTIADGTNSVWRFPAGGPIGATDISGAENNYVITVGNNSNEFISWGRSFYNLNKNEVGFSLHKDNIAGYGNADLGVAPEIIAGSDYYIAVGASKIYFKGKNYYFNTGTGNREYRNLFGLDTYVGNSTQNIGYVPVSTDGNGDATDFVKITDASANIFDEVDSVTELPITRTKRGPESFLNNAPGAVTTISSYSDKLGVGNGYIHYINASNKLVNRGNSINAKFGALSGIDFNQVVAGKIPSVSMAKTVAGVTTTTLTRPNAGTLAYGDFSPSPVPAAIGTGNSGSYTIADSYIDVKGTEIFISAALSTTYDVYAWNETLAATTTPVSFYRNATDAATGPTRAIVFDPTSTKIIKLSPGYGNNLFALDNTGKIYRITYNGGFKGILIDSFREPTTGANTKPIDNWAVSTTGKSVTLTGAYNPEGARNNVNGPSFTGNSKNNTFKVGAGYFYGNTAVSNDVKTKGADLADEMLVHQGAESFIRSSKSGDVYRIMLKSSVPRLDTNAAGNFNDGTGTISGLTTPEGETIRDVDLGTVEFFYRDADGDEEITPEALRKFLLYRAVYDSTTKDLHFEIKPLRSTMGKQIIMKFYIGRFDNINRFADLNATFYDAQRVELAMKFNNTTADDTPQYANTIADGNTAIPLLDPNNPYNKYYSIAVNNVSAGFDAIGGLLGNVAGFNTLVRTGLVTSDPGAPLNSKVDAAAGNLRYTMGTAADTYYNNRYLYLFKNDVDGNRYSRKSGSMPTKNGVEYVPVNLTLRLTTLIPDDDDAAKAAFKLKIDTDSGPNGVKSKFLQSFDNVYGFYGLRYDDVTNTLSLSYDVVRITATTSTETVRYTVTGQNADISTPIFTEAAATDKFTATYQEVLEENEGGTALSELYLPNVPFHVQASLRFKNNVVSGSVNGQNDTGIKTVAYAPNNVTKISMNLGETKPMTVELANLFNDTTRICFAYNGAVGETAYANFKSRIDPKLIDVTLERDKVTFQPRETADAGLDISFVVEVRRFVDTLSSIKFTNSSAVEQEVVRLEFHISSMPTGFSVNSNNVGSYSVRAGGLTVNVKDRINTNSWDYIKIADVLISDNNISSGNVSDRIVDPKIDGHTLKFTALKSGEVTVWYFLTRFNETISDSFKLVVESVSLLPYKLSIANSENIYLDTVKSSLRAMNASSSFQNFDSLQLYDESYDEHMPKGTYYQVYGDSDNDGIFEWETVKQSAISFIDSTVLSTSKDSIKLTLGNVSSSADQVRSRIVLRFISPDGTHTFEAAIEISPANKLLMKVAEDGVTYLPLNINITYGEDFPDQATSAASPVRNLNNSVTIPLTYFVNCLPQDQRYEFSGAKIGFVRPAEGYETYFSYEKAAGSNNVDVLIISPTYPTKLLETNGVMVSMSVNTPASGGNPSANYIFTFYISISGLTIDLDKEQYGQIFLITMLSVFALLLIVFFIRMTVFWRRKAQQKRIIRKNQMLIKMRDKMHNKTAAVSKEQLVRTKMKMEDPKYAKMFTTMRTDKEAETGISLDNSAIAQKAENKTKAVGKSKKKGKTSNIDQLKAELEAKKMAFAQMQGGVPPAMAMDSTMGGIEMDQSIIDSGPVFDNYQGGLSREDVESQIKAKLAEDSFLEFETIEPEENNIV